MKSGGTQLPIWRIPSVNSPAKAKASGNELNRLNSGRENLRHSAQCMAPPIPRLLSMRRIVWAGFRGSKRIALNPFPVMSCCDLPILMRSQKR
jgi:hypothetical protein